MTKRTIKTIIVAHVAGEYHVNYRRGDGYQAVIDQPSICANTLGWFDTRGEAQAAIDSYRYEQLKRAA
jgi:hypothetical protein